MTRTSIEHRFKMPDGSEIDILGIDPAWTPSHEIRLADGDRIQAVGLPGAVRQSVDMTIDTCRVSVAPRCLLIAVKLHAATEQNRPHDLDDVCAALLSYEQTGDRRFTIDYELFEDLEFETAGAVLAGCDTAEIAGASTQDLVDGAIDVLLTSTRLSDRFAEGRSGGDWCWLIREGWSKCHGLPRNPVHELRSLKAFPLQWFDGP